MAPHIIWPLRFVLPESGDRGPPGCCDWACFSTTISAGASACRRPGSLNLRTDVAGAALKPSMTRGFEYSDCWVMDARLVVLNARDAAARGAQILTHTEVISLERRDGAFDRDAQGWWLRAWNARCGARLVVNAAGPWVDQVLNRVADEPPRHHVRLVQGSHIVVRKALSA